MIVSPQARQLLEGCGDQWKLADTLIGIGRRFQIPMPAVDFEVRKHARRTIEALAVLEDVTLDVDVAASAKAIKAVAAKAGGL